MAPAAALPWMPLKSSRKLELKSRVIDVQSLLPFDIHGKIVESLKKTNRVLFLDEDVPGGTSAYMMQEVIEKQGGYYHLDSEPRTLSATPIVPPMAATATTGPSRMQRRYLMRCMK